MSKKKGVRPGGYWAHNKTSNIYNVLKGNKLFLLNFECIICTIDNIVKYLSALFASYSAIFALCYASVDTFYITKDNSHKQSKGKVVYLGR